MKKICMGILSLLTLALGAQTEADTSEIESTGEVLISADKSGEKRLNISRQIEVIDAKKIALAQQTNLGDILQQTGQVYLQKSQFGGGSPVLRGFEASRVLMVMDGVRLNNAIYRAGHVQDILSIDPFMLDRVEVIFGSASTLYGSDALGGAIYMKTKSPVFATDGKLMSLSATSRYASAANGFTGNAQLGYGSKKWALLLNATVNQFDDLRSGAVNYSNVPGFNDRPWYVERINGVDSQVINPDPRIQKGTGYGQWDVFGKFALKTGTLTHSLGVQYSSANNIPRYDRLWTTGSGGLPSNAVWNYTPQTRAMVHYSMKNSELSRWKTTLSLAAQALTIGRETRGYRKSTQKTQKEELMMYTMNSDNTYKLMEHVKLNFGLEAVTNDVTSAAEAMNVNTGAVTPTHETRYADGGGSTMSAAAYVGANWEIIPDDFAVNAGIRESYYKLEANYTPDNFLKLPYSRAAFSNLATTFHMGASKRLAEQLYLKGNVSTAFRNPNIDDMSKLFESVPGSKLLVPSEDLDPEHSMTWDFGLNYNIAQVLNIESGAYYTKVSDLIITAPGTLNGQDSILYDGQMTRVHNMQNAASGYIQGMYIGGKVKINRHLFVDGSIVSTFGRYKTGSGSGYEPLDHIPPTHGRVGIRWVGNGLQMEIFSIFNGKKRAMDYASFSSEDNVQQSPGGETPAWVTYNARLAWKLSEHWNITAACENIGDLGYRQFASGVSSAGRNLIFSANFKI